jgi:hypothetical protein
MSPAALLDVVDAGDFRKLFIDELGWNNPDRPPFRCDVDGRAYSLSQVAGYRGLRIWVCDTLPDKKTQREIDKQVGQDNLERLVIFVGADRQEWRWPRRAQTGGVNAKLLMHRHLIGDSDPHLDRQLRVIEIDLDDAPSLVDLLSRMRAAFDVEAESASVQAARLMGTLYGELDASKVSPDDATLLLARLLFLLFGDDSVMWKKDLFYDFVAEQTSDQTLHNDLVYLFEALNTLETLRSLPPGSPLADFRYVNGGLFQKRLALPPLTPKFRTALLSACDFDWQVISPAIFGSMFQTVKDKEARRHGGEHYTTEENIIKVIGPLFLDGLRDRLQCAWDDKGQLTKLHNELGRLRFFDPACGCGNFLVVAYRELRALELELLTRRRDLDEADGRSAGRNLSQRTLDVTGDINVTLDHFYGIEIEEWPARIAETAMLLVDHLANQRMEEDFGVAPDRLPIKLAPTIAHGNAVRIDWRQVLGLSPGAPADDIVVLGNPPFIGMAWLTRAQQEDNRIAFGQLQTSGLRTGRLDYVACWYAKAINLISGSTGRAAFVSTNSITQGEQARSMVPLLARHGLKVDFGHRTFKWTSEAANAAVVHVVIVGFSPMSRSARKRLFDYPTLSGKPVELSATRINFYLVDGPDLAPVKVRSPLVSEMPNATQGNKPVDDGNLIVTVVDVDEVRADPIASKYLRRFIQTSEMLYNRDRWCLWLVNATQDELRASPLIAKRLQLIRKSRKESPTVSVQQQAATPQLFTQIRQPSRRYLALPEVSTENREWIPGAFFEPDVIAGNKLIVWDTDKLWHFGYLQSSLYMGWVRTYCGRLKSDFSLSPGLVYFPFPFVVPQDSQRTAIEAAAQSILDERGRHKSASLAELYDPDRMPASLRATHLHLDEQIDGLYGLTQPTEAERMKVVLEKYEALIAPLISRVKARRGRRA